MKRDFLQLDDFTADELWEILHLAKELKEKFHRRERFKPFQDRSLAMIFAKPSARTRVSFETGFSWMGGHAIFLGPADIGIGKREAIKDIARLLNRYNDLIVARLFDHAHLLELAQHATIPVINGLTDYNHPCQIMADIFTIWERKQALDGLKIAYLGDGNNVVHSWLRLAAVFPLEFVCACPEDYEPDPATVAIAQKTGRSSITVVHDPMKAVVGADVVYTDVWASMGQKEEIAERERVFRPFQVNATLMQATEKNTFFMHCLPAERGREVTDEVMEADYSIVFQQAENRLHVQDAIMVTLAGSS